MKKKRKNTNRGLAEVVYAKPKLAPWGLGAAKVTQECAPAAPGKRVRVCIVRPEKPGPTLNYHDSVCHFLRGAARGDRESLYAIHLNVQNKVIGLEELAKGTLSEVASTPREVFKGAIMSNAAAIILAHNHPSGDPTPSQADMDFTARLIKAGNMLGIPLRDHVIVGADGCGSIRGIVGEGQGFGGARRRRRRR